MKLRAVAIALLMAGNMLAGCAARAESAAPVSPVASGGASKSNSAAPQQSPRTPPNDSPPVAKTADNASPSLAPAPRPDEAIASVGDTVITRDQLNKVLIEAYGLNMLAKVAQLELARTEARRRGIVVTPNDIEAETERYLATLFNEDKDPQLKAMNEKLEKAVAAKDEKLAESLRGDLRRERNLLLEQLLQQQRITRADFNLVMETNTLLRKLAESVLKDQPITDEALTAAFNHQYGEKVIVRHIQVVSHQEANEVKRRLAAGDDFAQLAREVSRNPNSAPLGGEVAPFSRDTPGYPQHFKDVSFALKVGEVSDTIVLGQEYHIVKLESRIAPRIVKFEDVREGVREFLIERQLEAAVREMRNKLQQDVTMFLKINDPVLQRQYDAQVNRKDSELRDRGDIRRQLDRHIEERQTTQPGTNPSDTTDTPPPTAPPEVIPATAPATTPATGP